MNLSKSEKEDIIDKILEIMVLNYETEKPVDGNGWLPFGSPASPSIIDIRACFHLVWATTKFPLLSRTICCCYYCFGSIVNSQYPSPHTLKIEFLLI